MKIGFRVDSSDALGLGHLNRSITLASEFKRVGVKVFFYSSNLLGNSDDLINEKGFNLTKLNKNKIRQNKFKKEYIIQDALKIVDYIKKVNLDLIIVDNYLINEKWEKIVSRYCKIALIHDFLQRKTYCNYLISYHLTNNRNISKFLMDKSCFRLTDSQYTIIKKKKSFLKKTINSKSVLIYMGGADKKNIISKLAKIFSNKFFNKFKFSLLTNRNKVKKLHQILNKNINFKIIYQKKKNLYDLASKHKYIISNMGLSMYEFAYAKKNIILIPQSKVHRKLTNYFKFYKMFQIIKKPKKKHFINFQRKFLEDNKTIKERADLYDAKGSKRLVNYFLKKFKKVELRAFKNTDKYFLFNLVNDPSVRFSSLKTNKIKFHNHIRWLNNLKRNKKNKLEILKCNDLKIGQIRLEKKQNFYNLDYSISNEFRRMGFGSKMIKLAIKKFKLQEIKAQTRANNISSIKTLEKSGFKRISKSKGIYNYLFSG